MESEGSRRQTTGLTDRNHIQGCALLGKSAKEDEAVKLSLVGAK
ncbi:MAG: hypothetical protein ACI4TK_00040 [Agathobacter sp.]